MASTWATYEAKMGGMISDAAQQITSSLQAMEAQFAMGEQQRQHAVELQQAQQAAEPAEPEE